jgi:hypothetical protein
MRNGLQAWQSMVWMELGMIYREPTGRLSAMAMPL